MRDRVPATERAIGAVCLVIAIGIVGGFIAQTREKKPPFFAVDPAKHPPVVPPELRHAQSLLPDRPAPGWVRQEPIRILDPTGVERSMPGQSASILEAGVVRTFEALYLNRADSRQQLTARIFELPPAEAAAALFDVTRPQSAVGEPAGVRGWRDGNERVGFYAGRYLTLIDGRNLPPDALLTPTLLARELADRQVPFESTAAVRPAGKDGPQSSPPAESKLPTVAPTIWSAPAGIAEYNPGNLWEKINGRAEQYLAFDFERLVFGSYALVRDLSATVDCYVYQMRDAVKAFGIYQAERPEHVTRAAIGNDGYRGERSLFFRKGRSYVQLVVGESAEVDGEQLTKLAEGIAAWLPDSEVGIWAESVLPKDGRVEGSFVFLAKDAFSLDFLGQVFAAEYESGDVRMTLFVHEAKDEPAARGLVEQYARHARRLGKVLERTDDSAGSVLSAEFSGEFDIIFSTGRYFGGATMASDLEAGRRRAMSIRDELKKR